MMKVWKISYEDAETRIARRPFYKLSVFAAGITKAQAIERVKNYHGNSARYDKFRGSVADGMKADFWFRD